MGTPDIYQQFLHGGIDHGFLTVAPVSLGLRAHAGLNGVCGQPLQGGNVILELAGQLADGTVAHGRRQVHGDDAVLVLEQVALPLQIQGRQAEVQAVDQGLQFAGFAFRKLCVGIQVDGQANTAIVSGAKAHAGVGVQGEAAVGRLGPQLLQAQGQGVGR